MCSHSFIRHNLPFLGEDHFQQGLILWINKYRSLGCPRVAVLSMCSKHICPQQFKYSFHSWTMRVQELLDWLEGWDGLLIPTISHCDVVGHHPSNVQPQLPEQCVQNFPSLKDVVYGGSCLSQAYRSRKDSNACCKVKGIAILLVKSEN